MSLRPSVFPTLVLAAVAALFAPAPARAVGPPIRLAETVHFAFPSRSLVVADLDGASGPDLLALEGTSVQVALNDGSGGFGAPITVTMGSGTLGSLVVADLNGDGRLDLAASSSAAAIVTRLNLGGMTFGPPESTSLPWRSGPIVLGDLNGDQRPDVVTPIPDSQSVAILWNDGSGRFGSPLCIEVGQNFSAPLVADFTGDGHADVLVAIYVPPSNRGELRLIVGHGDGTFDPAVTAVVGSTHRYTLVASDLDADGDLDVGASGDEDIVVYENLGSGVFAAPRVLSPGAHGFFRPYGRGIAAGDVDRDGFPDLVVVNSTRGVIAEASNYLVVHPHRGGFQFDAPRNYRVGRQPVGAALADLDRDGWLDGIATCDKNSDAGGNWGDAPAVYILRSAGPQGWIGMMEVFDPVWLPVRTAPGHVPDLVGAMDGRMYHARNRGHGLFSQGQIIGWGEPRLALDVDRDGDEDLLVASAESLWVQLQLPGGAFGAPTFVVAGLQFLEIADADGDGHLDFLATDAGYNVLRFPGDGTGGFGSAQGTGVVARSSESYLWPGAARDVNGDGRADLLFANDDGLHYDPDSGDKRYWSRFWLVWHLSDGAGGYAPPDSAFVEFRADYVSSAGGGPLRFGDWNGDGVLDVVCASVACFTGNTSWSAAFQGVGDGTFVGLPGAVGGGSMCDMAAGDLNYDRLDDLVFTIAPVGYTIDAIVQTSDGTGGFASTRYSMGELPTLVHLADLDGDGSRDVITRSATGSFNYDRYGYSIRRNVTPAPVPTPTLAALVSARVEDGVAILEWHAAGDAARIASVERRTERAAWAGLGAVAAEGGGYLRFRDATVEAGESYAYRLRFDDSARPSWTDEYWITVPAAAFALDGAWPNPSAGNPVITFALPAAGTAELVVLDIAGRVVKRERFEAAAAGRHRVGLGGARLPPGCFQVRLEFGERRARRSLVVVR